MESVRCSIPGSGTRNPQWTCAFRRRCPRGHRTSATGGATRGGSFCRRHHQEEGGRSLQEMISSARPDALDPQSRGPAAAASRGERGSRRGTGQQRWSGGRRQSGSSLHRCCRRRRQQLLSILRRQPLLSFKIRVSSLSPFSKNEATEKE